ncbi:hypothetical protein [Enterovibrio baiacu]|uniref:hypothetical protein n=1 Tax=Enterovibrio baiacu TaxID=2491023 RepID=UPI0010112B98|nr:hypothetical protein [Enterovibrio baiacu]MBE1275103.1 hypothetical protein [Enterovibrio baiacu]
MSNPHNVGVVGNVSNMKRGAVVAPKVASFTKYFREIATDPLVMTLYRAKVLEFLESNDFKKNQLIMKLIADKMVLDADAEISKEEIRIKAEGTKEMLDMVKKRLAEMSND